MTNAINIVYTNAKYKIQIKKCEFKMRLYLKINICYVGICNQKVGGQFAEKYN